MIAVGLWGLSPRDFWQLTITELWWLLESKLDQQPKNSHTLTPTQAQEFIQDLT